MRAYSFREVAFRLKQEARNLALFAKPPALPETIQPSAPLPDAVAVARALRGTPAEEAIISTAEQILQHRFPLLGLRIETGPEIRWRRDYQSGKETPDSYFRAIPYLNSARVGDHKFVWELNRHQHLILLAQAYLLTEGQQFLDEIAAQLESWFLANRFQRGINWASALEVGFRALSFLWVEHLVGPRLRPVQRRRLLQSLYQHGFHLEANLSVYFSPNTHLLGEAVALHALGIFFRGMSRAHAWERQGARVVAERMAHLVHADGSYIEQSASYHLYALDMLLFHAVLVPPSDEYRGSLARMARYLDALMGDERTLPSIGDDDGGRFFHPFGPRDRFGRATLATAGWVLGRPEWIARNDLRECAVWWLGPRVLQAHGVKPVRQSAWFEDAGVAVMHSGDARCIVQAGPFGPFRGSHGHSDKLSLVVRAGGQDLLIDAGTFTYDHTSPWRRVFRGTAAHNTVRVGGRDQADPAGAFGWQNSPEVIVRQWETTPAADFLDAECRYRDVRHRRRVFFWKPGLLFVLDDVECGGAVAEQFWHPAAPVRRLTSFSFRLGEAGTLLLAPGDSAADCSESGEFGWRSEVYGLKQPSPVVVMRRPGAGQFGSVVAFSASAVAGDAAGTLELVRAGEDICMTLSGPWKSSVTFPREGLPRLLE